MNSADRPAGTILPTGIPPAGRFALLAALCSSFGQTFYIGLFGAEFRADFGLEASALGLLYGTATLLSGLSMFWLGAIADHMLMRRAIALTMSLLAVGTVLITLSPHVAGLFIGLILIRLAGRGLTGHLAIVAAGRYAVRRRGRAVAMATYGFILGEALFPPTVAAAMGRLDWRGVWLFATVILVAIALPLLYVLARPLVGEGGSADADVEALEVLEPSVLSRRELFINARFLRALAVVLVSSFIITALFLHQGTLAEWLDWSLDMVASGFVLFAAMQGLAAFAGGRLVDRFSARALLPAAMGVLALGLLPPVAAMWVMFAGLGLSAGINGVVSGAVWVELFGTAKLGMIRGVYAALMVVSTATGPVALGLLFNAGVSLLAMGIFLAVYVVVVPNLVAGRRLLVRNSARSRPSTSGEE